MAASPLLVEGGLRLPRAEEVALNFLLRREGGEHQGMQLYKLGWAAEDNSRHVIPICFHENPLSYHLLSWEPPTMALQLFEKELKEDTSKGTYNCITHFIDGEGVPFKPTAFIIERLIPILRRAHETAIAALRGERVIVERNRAIKREEIRAREAAKEKAYDNYAESILLDSRPAFDGNPMSTSKASAGKTLSDIKSSPHSDQPDSFDFNLRPVRPPVPEK